MFHTYDDNLRPFHKLPFSMQKTLIYQSKIHGMYYHDKKCFDAEYMVTDIKHKLFNMLTDYKRNQQSVLVAYKGGTFKQQLLNKLGFDGVNIEFLGCPKVDELRNNLVDSYLQSTTVCMKYQCISGYFGQKFCHCSRHEVVLFRYFLYDLIKLCTRDLLSNYACC